MKPKGNSHFNLELRIKIIFLFILLSSLGMAQDVPPGVPNVVSFSAGSYIIPMDNDKQA